MKGVRGSTLRILWHEMEGTDFISSVLQQYDKRHLPPNSEDSPITVNVSLDITAFDAIDETNMDFTIHTMIIQEWHDQRLMFYDLTESATIELGATPINEIWVPDLYVTNEKTAKFHDITMPNRMIHLHRDGTVLYRMRVTMTASCPLKLNRYPHDAQICSLYLQSFSYTKNRLQLRWNSKKVKLDKACHTLSQFEVTHWIADTCGNGHNASYIDDAFSCIKVDFYLERNMGFHMLHIYIPSFLTVFISWVSFWLNVDAISARISLGVVTVLTMTTHTTTTISSLPSVSYIKAIDIWMTTCLIFVFSALLEFAFVNVFERQEVERKNPARQAGVKAKQNTSFIKNDAGEKTGPKYVQGPFGKGRAHNLDKASRVLFPLIFILFCATYWIIYSL